MKKKMKVGLLAIVAIAAVMMFSSYAGALSQDEIAGLMLNASEVDTYKFDMNTTMTMTTEMLMGNETNATEPMVMVMVGNGSGVVDNINKSMMIVMSTCMNMSEIMGDENTEDLSSQWAGQWEGTTRKAKLFRLRSAIQWYIASSSNMTPSSPVERSPQNVLYPDTGSSWEKL